MGSSGVGIWRFVLFLIGSSERAHWPQDRKWMEAGVTSTPGFRHPDLDCVGQSSVEACGMAWPKLEEADLRGLEVKSRDGEEGKAEVHRR